MDGHCPTNNDCLFTSRKLRGLKCFVHFDRIRGWFDTQFEDSEGFTVSESTYSGQLPVYVCMCVVILIILSSGIG